MKENNNIYIPHNLQKDALPLFHIDNIDFIEDTPDGKGTTHALIMTIFQKRLVDPASFCLDVKQQTTSLTLKKNSFNELQRYSKPQRSHADDQTDASVSIKVILFRQRAEQFSTGKLCVLSRDFSW